MNYFCWHSRSEIWR